MSSTNELLLTPGLCPSSPVLFQIRQIRWSSSWYFHLFSWTRNFLDYAKILELDPSLREIRRKKAVVDKQIEERNEKLKKEMLGIGLSIVMILRQIEGLR